MGRQKGIKKNADRRRIKNPFGRKIDFGGRQYNELIKNGYKLNDDETHLVPGDKITLGNKRGRPRGMALKVPESKKVKNPETGRMVIKTGATFRKLVKKFYYDVSKNEIITVVRDPKLNDYIQIDSPEFKNRMDRGYIYNKQDNSLTEASRKSEKAFKNRLIVHDLTIVNKADPIVQMKLLEQRVKVKILKSLKEMRGIKFNTGLDVVFSKQDKDGRLIIQVFYIASKARTITNESEIDGAL